MQTKQIILILLIFVLIACSPAPTSSQQPSVETIVAGTLEALTAFPFEPTATAINGTQITFSKISFVIPDGIATSATEEKLEAVSSDENMGWWSVYPTHARYPLQGYPIAQELDTVSIYVYPIAEYAAINEDVAKRIESLKSLIATPDQQLPEPLPFLPPYPAGQFFRSNFQPLAFQNGSGIRYITGFSQFPEASSISNNIMVYTFQGITSDGLYYVSAEMPINIGFLIGYPEPTEQGNFEEIKKQVELVTQQLNNSTPESFTPSMTSLDALIQSINVTGIP